MQNFYTRLFIAQLLFVVILLTTPNYAKASTIPKNEARVYSSSVNDFQPIQLPSGMSIEDLPVYTKVIDSEYW